MRTSPWRFEVRVVDRRILEHYIKFRGLSYAQLAAKVGCSKATIGHLVSGHVKVTRPEWAKTIERELDAPPGSLFAVKVSRVSENAA
jgi:plasmid maintenance system antidote protein VapI